MLRADVWSDLAGNGSGSPSVMQNATLSHLGQSMGCVEMLGYPICNIIHS